MKIRGPLSPPVGAPYHFTLLFNGGECPLWVISGHFVGLL
jgi:hypothetical protein